MKIFKKAGLYCLIFLIVVNAFSVSAIAATANQTSSHVFINGTEISFGAYTIDGNNYFKLRDIAYALNGTNKQFNVGYDANTNTICLTSGEAYVAVGGEMITGNSETVNVEPTVSKVLKDGEEISLKAYSINGNNYFKLRDLGEAFDFSVDWDESTNAILIDTKKGYDGKTIDALTDSLLFYYENTDVLDFGMVTNTLPESCDYTTRSDGIVVATYYYTNVLSTEVNVYLDSLKKIGFYEDKDSKNKYTDGRQDILFIYTDSNLVVVAFQVNNSIDNIKKYSENNSVPDFGAYFGLEAVTGSFNSGQDIIATFDYYDVKTEMVQKYRTLLSTSGYTRIAEDVDGYQNDDGSMVALLYEENSKLLSVMVQTQSEHNLKTDNITFYSYNAKIPDFGKIFGVDVYRFDNVGKEKFNAYRDYLKQYENEFTEMGMSKDDIEAEALRVSGYDANNWLLIFSYDMLKAPDDAVSQYCSILEDCGFNFFDTYGDTMFYVDSSKELVGITYNRYYISISFYRRY